MADTQQLKAIITASASGFVDALKQATTAVNGSTADWRTRLAETQNNIKTAEGAVKNLAETAKQLEGMHVDISGVPELAGQLDNAGRNLEQLRADVNGAVDSLTRLRNEGSQLGINFQDYQRLSEAVQSAGADMGKFGGVIRTMNSMVQGLANGVPEAVSEFNRLGLSIEELASKSPVQQMDAIATAIDHLVDPIHRAEAANRMFASSLADVQKVNDEYRKSLQTNASGNGFATDQDYNRLVQQGNALDKIAASLASVQAQAAQPAEMDISKRIDEAIGRCTEFVQKSKEMANEYLEMSGRMNGATEEHVLKSSNAWDAYFKKVRQMYKDIEAEAQAARDKSRIGFGGGGDTGFDEEYTKKTTLMIRQFELIRKEAEQVRTSVQKGFGLNTKADRRAADELMARLNAVRDLFRDIAKTEGGGLLLESQFNSVKQTVDDLRSSIERGNAAIDKMNADAEKGVSIWRRMADGVRDLWRQLRGVKSAANDVKTSASGGLEQVAGMLTGMGSKIMVVVKSLKEVGNAISYYLIEPFRDAYKEIEKLATRKFEMPDFKENMGKWDKAKQDLLSYWEAYRKSVKEGASEEDREAERQARVSLEREHGIIIDPSMGMMDEQMAAGLELSQRKYLDALRKQEDNMREALEEYDKAIETQGEYLRRMGLTDTQRKMDAEMLRLQESKTRMLREYSKVQMELQKAEKQTPVMDWAGKENARRRDEHAAAVSELSKEAADAQEEHDRELSSALDDFAKWADEATLAEGQRRVNEILDRYAKAVEAGVDRETARQVMMAALSKELEKQYNDEVAARKKLVDAYRRAWQLASDAVKQERDAAKSLYDAQIKLAEVRRQQARDERQDAIAKKRERLQERMAKFGFSLDKDFKLKESPAERRERRRNVRLDERISEKLARREQGRPVHFTSREQKRLDEYRRLQKQDAGLEREEKAMRSSEMQYNASKSLQEAAAAIRVAAIALAKSGGVLPKDLKKILADVDKEAAKKRKKSGVKPDQKQGPNRIRKGGKVDRAVREAQAAWKRVPAAPTRKDPAKQERVSSQGRTYAEGAKPKPKPEEPKPAPSAPKQVGVSAEPEYPNQVKQARGRADWLVRMLKELGGDKDAMRRELDKVINTDPGTGDVVRRLGGSQEERVQALEQWAAKQWMLKREREKKEGGIPQASVPDLSKALAGVVLPERIPTGELPKDHDYTSLLEGIRTAIENGNQNKFTVV